MVAEQIAIIAWGAMADVLYATPIVRHIRELHPDAKITWYVRDKFAPVVENNPHVDIIRKCKLPEGYSTRQQAEYDMDQEILKAATKESDKVYDLQYWPRHSNFYERHSEDFISLRARNAGLSSDAIRDRRIVLDINNNEQREALLFLLKNISDIDENGAWPVKFITVNHISYAASPVWSFDNYEKLVSILNKKDIRCVFTGAPNEPIPQGAIDARGMPYMSWAKLIDMSNLWLGLDSGAVALACASDTNVPIIKLHSPDFPINKTGIKAMGLRDKDVLELCPAPSPESLADIIMDRMRDKLP